MDMANQNRDRKSGFEGEWLTYDASQGIQQWLIWSLVMSGDEIWLNENSGRRRPAEGKIVGGKAKVEFSDDAGKQYEAALINENIIEWNGDAANHWFRKGSQVAYGIVLGKKRELLENEGLIEGYAQNKEVNLRILVNDWVQDIASGDLGKNGVIEETAEEMRTAASVVRYLVFQLSQEFHPKNGQETAKGEIAEKSARAFLHGHQDKPVGGIKECLFYGWLSKAQLPSYESCTHSKTFPAISSNPEGLAPSGKDPAGAVYL